jgi:methylmalonyl-CoA mutase N-terminal domain/subunit
VDPLGGSHYVEWLTAQMEQGCHRYFEQIGQYGGVIPAIEAGFFQREIAEAAYQYQQAVESGRQVVVGVNEYVSEDVPDLPILKVDQAGEARQTERLRRVRRERSAADVTKALHDLERAARGTENLMPPILEAVKTYATLGEICDVLRGIFGEYRETPAL